MTASKNYFTDLDLNFKPNFINKDVLIKINEDAVKRAIRNLILIRRYEKPFHPEISSGIQDLLFENSSPVIYGVLQSHIEELIRKYEPRVKDIAIKLSTDMDNNAVNVNIKFTVINQPQIIETNILLERAR